MENFQIELLNRLYKHDLKHHLFFNIDLPIVKIHVQIYSVFIFKNVFKLYVVTYMYQKRQKKACKSTCGTCAWECHYWRTICSKTLK